MELVAAAVESVVVPAADSANNRIPFSGPHPSGLDEFPSSPTIKIVGLFALCLRIDILSGIVVFMSLVQMATAVEDLVGNRE